MKELDPLLHSQLRLAVMSILLNVEEADFNYIKEKTESTAGNLSVQLDKLVTAGYISKTTDGWRKTPNHLQDDRHGAQCHDEICGGIEDVFCRVVILCL